MTYTVHHVGGSTPITVNQQQNGGTWNYLGQFSMAPSSNHRVVVADSSTGVVVADAVRLVSAGTGGGTGLFYVHADHLGTPQKMTDGNQALVWDAVYKPFGETHAITGTASNNQRFPGQYADAETGFSYNYFRDYDPSTGRYVESDPIGLLGGVNTFVYAQNSSVNLADQYGLQITPFPFIRPIPIPLPRPVPRPIPIPLPIPNEDFSDKENKDHCLKLYVRCVQENWGGNWSCGQCHFFCTGINKEWPFEHCSPDFSACNNDEQESA